MLFTPAELYGAMAQCSSRAKMEQHPARAQVQMRGQLCNSTQPHGLKLEIVLK